MILRVTLREITVVIWTIKSLALKLEMRILILLKYTGLAGGTTT